MSSTFRQHTVLPGFNLALGFTLLYLSLIVLIPLSAAFIRTAALTWPQFWDTVTTPRVVASYRLTFEQYDYAGATALAVVMLVISFVLLLLINLLQWWSRRRSAMT